MNHPQGKTSELVERLKRPAWLSMNDCRQIASELTRLEAEVGKLRAEVDEWIAVAGGLSADAQRLEDEVSRLQSLNVEAVGAARELAEYVEKVWPSPLAFPATARIRSLLSRLQSGSENKGLGGVPGDLARASGVFSPENEAGDSAPHHTRERD